MHEPNDQEILESPKSAAPRRRADAPGRRRDPEAPEVRDAGRRRRRHVVEAFLGLSVLAVVGVSATTLLGRNASSKFSSVGSAICDVRGVVDGDVVFRRPVGPRSGPIAAGAILTSRRGFGTGDAAAGGILPAQRGLGTGDTPAGSLVTRRSLGTGDAELACGGGGGAYVPYASSPSGGLPAVQSPPAPSASGPVPASPLPAPAKPTSFAVDALAQRPVPSVAAAGHVFVSTATLTVIADDVAEAKEKAIVATEAVGGGLFGEQTSFSGDAKAILTFKVPPVQFRSLLSDLARLGTLSTEEVKTDDVTQQVIDLDARIAAGQSSLDRTRALLNKANALPEIAQYEQEVTRREGELETLRGQQRTLSERVALSTIVLTLQSAPPPVPAPPPPPAPPEAKPLPGFSDGLGTGWKAFTNVGTVTLAVVGAVLPFVPVVVVPLAAWWAVRRVRRRPSRDIAPTGAY